ncbi:MAG: hypothetical protein M1269_13835 [Chloroflexi bacterium]|nr:hypothetical protein [Chloroflexota bacterium]
MRKKIFTVFLAILAALLLSTCIWADTYYPDTIYSYNRDNGEYMPVKSLYSRTVVEGPVARTTLHYIIENKYTDRTEVCFNLFLPKDTLLTGFGYYYKGRFIKGTMYDTEEAWKIYRAVTSRGRDPGVMDRPSAQEYHAQIFPVEPKQDLKVELELVQVIDTDEKYLKFELPVAMPSIKDKQLYAQMRVEWLGAKAEQLNHNFADRTSGPETKITSWQEGDRAVVKIAGQLTPDSNWIIRRSRPSQGLLTLTYSGFNGWKGYYVTLISPPYEMTDFKATLSNHIGTGLSMPTLFSSIPAYGRIYIAGTYIYPGWTDIRLKERSGGKAVETDVRLSGRHLSYNAAGPIWADKRIDILQNDYSKNNRDTVIKLSKKFNVVSRFTALLAIPKEELEYYKNVLAKEKIQTNTKSVGGGGGDPWISVKAPVDALRVVAVFPNGEAKSLNYDEKKKCWSGRFDIPFGTAAGTYRVTVILVHKDGKLTRFILEYDNLLGETISANATTLTGKPGGSVILKVTGDGIERGVVVTPWGERYNLGKKDGHWEAGILIPKDTPAGKNMLTVVLMDGAHNRTEIEVDLDIK